MEVIHSDQCRIAKLEEKISKKENINKKIDDDCDHQQPQITEKFYQRDFGIKVK